MKRPKNPLAIRLPKPKAKGGVEVPGLPDGDEASIQKRKKRK